MAGDLETKLTMNRPCSERASFTVRRKDSSTKSAAGQAIPELCRQQNKIKKGAWNPSDYEM